MKKPKNKRTNQHLLNELHKAKVRARTQRSMRKLTPLAKRIADQRADCGLLQKHCAEAFEVNWRTWLRWETGQSKPVTRNKAKVAAWLEDECTISKHTSKLLGDKWRLTGFTPPEPEAERASAPSRRAAPTKAGVANIHHKVFVLSRQIDLVEDAAEAWADALAKALEGATKAQDEDDQLVLCKATFRLRRDTAMTVATLCDKSAKLDALAMQYGLEQAAGTIKIDVSGWRKPVSTVTGDTTVH